MTRSISRWILQALVFFVAFIASAHAVDDDAASYVTTTPAASDANRLEALRRYGLGVLSERRQRYLESLDHYAAAADLDPDAVAPKKALLPLYLALDRHSDAVVLTRRILKLAPDDYEVWYLYSRQLQVQAKVAEASAALAHTVSLPSVKRDPQILAQASMDLARLQEESGEIEKSISTLENAIRALEEHHADLRPVELHVALGRVLAKADKHAAAVTAFQLAQKFLPEDDVVGLRRLDYELARMHAGQGKANEALGYLDRFLLTLPSGTEPYVMKIQLLAEAGCKKDIVKALESAVALDPHNMALRLLLAKQLVEEQKFSAAENAYRTIAAESPSAEVYRGLFHSYRTQGRMCEVIDQLDAAIAAGLDGNDNHGDAGARNRARAMLAALREDAELSRDLLSAVRPRQFTEMKSETRRFLAAIALRSRQFVIAEDLYRTCLEEDAPLPIKAVIYDGLLRALWSAGKHEAVAEICRKGMTEATALNQLPFHGNLARALVVLGKSKEALAEADRAVLLSDAGNRLPYRLLRVEILTMARKYALAEESGLELLQGATTPADVRRIRYVLSHIYTTTHAYEKSEEQLRIILHDDPDDATANNDLGYILADQGKNLDEAESLIRKALILDEKRRRAGDADNDSANAAFVDSLGWVLFRKGQLAEARRELERAAAIPEGAADPVVWDHLGDVYFGLGDTEGARTTWEKARALYESEKRRSLDDQYNELKRKLQQLGSESKQRGFLGLGFSLFEWKKR